MREEIENIIKKNLPEKKEDINYPNMLYHTEAEKIGFNQALSSIDTALIADEILKVVRNEIASIRGFHLLKQNTTKEDILDSLYDLLSTLSTKEENI